MVRFISVVLLFVLFFSLAIPAVAVAYVADQHDVVDLLTSYQYSVYKGTTLIPANLFNYYDVPCLYASGSKSYIFAWLSPNVVSVSSFHITIVSTTQPSSVSFVNSHQSYGFTYTATYVGSSPTVNGCNRYYYRIDDPVFRSPQFGLRIMFDSTYAGTLMIESFSGYSSNVYSVSSVSYDYKRIYSAKPDNASSDGFIYYEYDSGTDYLSTFFLDEFWWGENSAEYREPFRFDASYLIDLSSYPVLDAAYIRFYALGLTGDLSISLVDYAGIVVYALPPSQVSSTVSVSDFNTNFASFNLYEYAVSVDLSGYDLTGLYLRFAFSTPYLMASSVEELSYAYGGLYDVSLVVPVTDRAWYAGIVDFFESILNTFMNIVRTLTNWVIDLYNACVGFFDNLLLTLNDHFNYFLEWSANALDALTGSEEDQQEAEQFEQEANKSNQDLNDLSGKLDAVSRPDIDNIDIAVDSYIPADGITLLTSPFNIVFGNGYIFKILSVSLIMALVSYVLFGKR